MTFTVTVLSLNPLPDGRWLVVTIAGFDGKPMALIGQGATPYGALQDVFIGAKVYTRATAMVRN